MMGSFAGIDVSRFPGLPTMAWLRKNTNLTWCGFYLKAPSHPDGAWMGQRGALTAMGWGLAPIYVGQQVVGPGGHRVTTAQGSIDGGDAAAQMRAAGFPPGSFCYLDLENGLPFTTGQQAYGWAWCAALAGGHFGPGIYCSYQMAAQVRALRPDARLWVFHVSTTAAHNVEGPTFPTPAPSDSKYPDAYIWQRDDEARIVVPGSARLGVDLDVALSADPSAPSTTTAPAVPGNRENGKMPIAIDDIRGIQSALNTLGANPQLEKIDGSVGLLTRAAISAFQTKTGLPATGQIDQPTVDAINMDLTVGGFATSTPATTSAAAPPSIPTVNDSVKVDPGSAMASLIETFRPQLDALADTAENMVFASIPMGSFIESFIGPHLARQYVDAAITQGETMAKTTGNPIFAQASSILAAAEQAFTVGESWLAMIGIHIKIPSWVTDAAAKVGLKI